MRALLCPTPQIFRPYGESFPAPTGIALAQEGSALLSAAAAAAVSGMFTRLLAGGSGPVGFPVRLRRTPMELPDAYRLHVRPSDAVVEAASAAGAHHALATLCQLCMDERGLRECKVEDAPMLPVRGYMLDISRNRVPRMQTLEDIADLLWLLKFNQFQLYTEHTFAFSGHERVWQSASPLTANEVRTLQDCCGARGIELVPNLNSLGHFERWLRHPEYGHLAETPGGTVLPGGRVLEHCTTLAPGDTAIDFLRGLYAEFLPLFESSQFNGGLDEPWELGFGRSRERCEREGKQAVYLDHLLQVAQLAAEHGKRLQFWADIVLEDPDCVAALPKDVTGLVWGYEADHPFEELSEHFAASGIPFILCPGTSTWNSIGGRWPTAEANIRSCAAAALRNGAQGILLTDWGDNGHHQPLCVSLPPLVHAAQLAWSARPGRPVADVIDALILRDPSRRVGMALLTLGSLPAHLSPHIHNNSWLSRFLFSGHRARRELLREVDAGELHEVCERIQWLREELDAVAAQGSTSRMRLPRSVVGSLHDAIAEQLCAADLLEVAAFQALAELGAAAESPGDTDTRFRQAIRQFEATWHQRSRPGGLDDSVRRLVGRL